MTSGAPRMVGFPSTGYHKRFAPTKMSRSSANWPATPSRITTIHLYWKVWSDIGFPSLSGYSISWCGTRVTLAMIAEASGTIGNGGRNRIIPQDRGAGEPDSVSVTIGRGLAVEHRIGRL